MNNLHQMTLLLLVGIVGSRFRRHIDGFLCERMGFWGGSRWVDVVAEPKPQMWMSCPVAWGQWRCSRRMIGDTDARTK